MQVSVIKTDQGATIRLEGRFDFGTHRDFRAAVDKALLETAGNQLVVDLGAVDYVDSSALGMLLMLRDKANTVHKTASLVNARGNVRQVLDIANFGKLFSID